MSIGVASFRPRTVPIKRVVLLPLLFLAWSAYGLYQKILLGQPSLLFPWLLFLALGTCLGIMEVRSWKISVNHRKREITIPGNRSTLILILLIFVLKFFWGYMYATRTEISWWIYFADTITSALVTGFFVGRAAFFFKNWIGKS